MFDGMATCPGTCPRFVRQRSRRGGLLARFRVRLGRVGVVSPGSEHEPGMSALDELRLVEAFVAKTTIEAFHEAALHRLAGHP